MKNTKAATVRNADFVLTHEELYVTGFTVDGLLSFSDSVNDAKGFEFSDAVKAREFYGNLEIKSVPREWQTR